MLTEFRQRLVPLAPGIGLCLAIAGIAWVLGGFMPIIGAAVFAILLGLAIAGIRPPGVRFAPGIAFASKQILQWSIVLLGLQLDVHEILTGGASSLPVMLGTLVLVLFAAFVFGKMLGIDRELRRLLAVGTAICGGSAIAAMSSALDSDQADVTYALSTVFLFNIVAVVLFPAIGHLFAFSQVQFGLWAGTAINDTSSVVAAAFAFGAIAGKHAIVVKLTRTTLIIPIVAFYAGKRAFAARGQRGVNWGNIIPWFVLWFIAAAALNGTGLIPLAWHPGLQDAALFCIAVALAGVGLSAEYAKIRAAGFRPLLLGAILWAVISVSSLLIAHLVHL